MGVTTPPPPHIPTHEGVLGGDPVSWRSSTFPAIAPKARISRAASHSRLAEAADAAGMFPQPDPGIDGHDSSGSQANLIATGQILKRR